MNKIVPGLFVGNIKDAENKAELQENGITHIVSIHDQRKVRYPGIVYLPIEAADESCQDLKQFFHECNKFIHDARISGGVVLVHCLAGISRSVTVTAAYLTTVTSHCWTDALFAIQQSRQIAKPNRGFREQLEEYRQCELQQERSWFHQTYGLNKFNDEIDVKVLADQYRAAEAEKELRQKKFMEDSAAETPPPAEGNNGSFSSELPLNKPDELTGSATTANALRKKREGGLYFEDSAG